MPRGTPRRPRKHTQTPRYDAIELLDTYEDEDEDRAVEAFELAASAAVKSRNLKHAGGNTFERSRSRARAAASSFLQSQS